MMSSTASSNRLLRTQDSLVIDWITVLTQDFSEMVCMGGFLIDKIVLEIAS